jgi:diaminopimelate epimerase
MADPRPLTLTKHHGAGNDFLVVVDPDREAPLTPAVAAALCDRRFGVGADGLLRVGVGDAAATGADLTMELWNRDGSVAEMSGNGIRCLAQAAVDAGLVDPPSFTVATAAGVRLVEYRRGSLPGAASARVSMGPVGIGADQPQSFPDRRAREVDVGNPHLVLLSPGVAEVDLDALGPRLQQLRPGGVNVEVAEQGPGADALTIRIFERGVGETEACGTGSVAAAAAAHSWGLVGPSIDVHNPGGTLRVDLDAGEALLSGPVRRVAVITVDLEELAGAARP